jgi:rubrerythrin
MPIPMMTDSEWAEVRPLLQTDIEQIKQHRLETGIDLKTAIEAFRHAACERYFEITGFRETNPNALWHHHLSNYGPECPQCGHLFRTPQASFCAKCGFRPAR